MRTYKRLTLDDRIVIQAEIAKGKNASDIARRLKVSPSTITREVFNNGRIVNPEKKFCSGIRHHLSCNQCMKRGLCTGKKLYYDFNVAEQKSKKAKESKKNPFSISKEDLVMLDKILVKGIRENNLSIHHVYSSYEELASICSERTVVRYVVRGLLDVKAHELHRFVRFDHSKKYAYAPYPTKSAEMIANRTYGVFLNYIKENPGLSVVQYDSVEGKITSSKALLTITLKESDFQFGYLYNKEEGSTFVVSKMKELYGKLGVELSKKVFAISISDNGCEFAQFPNIETNNDGEEICKTFFTRPYKSTDKPECERNHEIVRYCLPKGKDFDHLTQDDIDQMFSNINSYIRKSKNDKTPYEIVKEKFGIEFLQGINIKEINKKEVKLSPLV